MPDTPTIYLISGHSTDGRRRSRTFGWHPTEAAAREAAIRNYGSMDEAIFSWLCIEESRPGIFAPTRVVQWYVWRHEPGEEGHWVESSAGPAWAQGVVNFGIG